jgi:hypothetical protein
LPNAARLHHFRWRKKKAESFIIPPTYFRNSGYSITEVKPKAAPAPKEPVIVEDPIVVPTVVSNSNSAASVNHAEIPKAVEIAPIVHSDPTSGTKVSALSLASIRAKRELEATQKASVKHYDELPKEAFSETDMLLQWNNFAQRLNDKGQKIMATYMLINDPTLEGTTIRLELPNEGSKVDFDASKNELLGYLRGKLHNHDIVIDVHVNESTETKYAFTPLEKYERLKTLNPAMELLRKTFDLDV